MKRKSIILLTTSLIFLFTSCSGSSVTQEQHDKVVQKYEEVLAERDQLLEENNQLTEERDQYKDAYDNEHQLRESSDQLYQEALSELEKYKEKDNSADSSEESVTVEESKTDESETITEDNTREIESTIQSHVRSEYSMTDIDSITVNEDLGTEEDGDYVVLVNLTWKQKNSADNTKNVLELYSDDLAATIVQSHQNVQEIAIFWTVPYLNDASIKICYENKSGSMYQSDSFWPSVFN